MSVSQRSTFSSVSPSYRKPGGGARVDDSPITDFVRVIDHTPQGAWQKRTTAFENLIKQIPEGAEYGSGGAAWFNNPPTLRNLAHSISELLKDARSTVVKRTCGSLLTLFSRCQSDARYLFKDLMPTVLSVHAQTVQVIRQAVQFMVMEAIPEVPCKMVMPLWMERLKVDKSRTVRDACALYLGQALQSWTDDGYLSEEIWNQVGKALIASLRDPAPAVRTNAKAALENMQRLQPVYFDNLITNPDGPAASDPKLSKWLQSLGQGQNPDPEELSIMSRVSYNSRRGGAAGASSNASVGSQTPRRTAGTPRGSNPRATQSADKVPTSIALAGGGSRRASPTPGGVSGNGSVSSATRGKASGLTPPTSRRSDLFGRRPSVDSTGAPATPNRVARSIDPAPSPMTASPDAAKNEVSLLGVEPSSSVSGQAADEAVLSGSPTAFPADLGVPALRQNMTGGSNGVTSPTLSKPAAAAAAAAQEVDNNSLSAAEMPDFSKRRSRNSVLIQQRLKMSSSSIVDDDGAGDAGADNRPPKFPKSADDAAAQAAVAAALPPSSSGQAAAQPPPEHMVIAIRLLKAHKAHVDAIMETLRIEMDTLRDFDRLLEEPGRPTEDEVLDYFESVGLCLEQRTVAGVQMQEELDRVSRGEPPNE